MIPLTSLTDAWLASSRMPIAPKKYMLWSKKQFSFVASISEFELYLRCCLQYDTTGRMYFTQNADFILFQSTGVFDKNGVEIYEGSIIQKGGKNYVVIFHEGEYMCMRDGVPQSSLKAMAKHAMIAGHVMSDIRLSEEV